MSPPVLTCYTDIYWTRDQQDQKLNKWKDFSYSEQPRFLVFEKNELHHTLFMQFRVLCCSPSRTRNPVADTSFERPQTGTTSTMTVRGQQVVHHSCTSSKK
ncbi:hypothetical protein NPIL_277991 [Nephila pilipes]|uniref:Uncharacterized protein n=1 Tax=Nephila pilipes TaxID=299642 RepID=A0A8X6TYC6_NEPPI|nr:hypothetical protein NPIL_166081 [Nephila pilipes]GFU58525.1 hypothetical protein NPIL_277991 [Nephila pilipes]